MTLAIVFLLLVLIGTWAYMSSRQSRGVLAQSQRAHHSEHCNILAEMAIREAVHVLRSRANDTTHTLSHFLRKGATGASEHLVIEDLPHTRQEVERIDGYSAGPGVKITVFRRGFATLEAEERVPHETLGTLLLEVKITGPKNSWVSATEQYGFRSLLMTPSRPFDQFTFFLGDPATLLNKGAHDGDGNKTISLCFDRPKQHRKGLQELADKLAATGEKKIKPLQQIFAQGAGAGWPQPEWKVEKPGVQTDGVANTLHFFDWPICLYSLADEVTLDDYNLPKKITPLVQQADVLQQQIDQQVAAIQAMFKGSPSMGQAQAASQQLVDMIHQEARHMNALLAIYKEFQDKLVEVGNPLRETYLKRARTFSPREQQWRAAYRFEGTNAAGYAEDFLRTVRGPGAIFVQNLDRALNLRLPDFQGRLFLAVEGDVNIQSASVEDPAKDSITIVSTGATEVQGKTQASVVAWGGHYDTNGRTVEGALILDTLHSTAPIDAILTGKIRRLPGLLSGPAGYPNRPEPFPESIWVNVAPMPCYRRIQP